MAGLRHRARRPGAGRRARPPRTPSPRSAPRSRSWSAPSSSRSTASSHASPSATSSSAPGPCRPSLPSAPSSARTTSPATSSSPRSSRWASRRASPTRRAAGETWLSWIDSRRAKWVVLAVGRGPRARAGGSGLALARRRRQPERGARVLRPAPALGPQALDGSRVLGLVGALACPRRRGRAAHRGPAPRRRATASSPSPASRATSPAPYRLGLWRDTLRLAASSPCVGSGLRRLRGRPAPLQDRGGRLPRRARRERPPGVAGRRWSAGGPTRRCDRPGALAPGPEGPPHHGPPPRAGPARGRAGRRSHGSTFTPPSTSTSASRRTR